MNKKHLLFLLNEIREIPQKTEEFKKLINEQLDNIIYKINIEVVEEWME